MPGRTYSTEKYQYGFNGKRADSFLNKSYYDFGERIYDSRVGRFLSTDPYSTNFPQWSPYAFAFDSPLQNVDKDGKFPIWGIIAGLVEGAIEFSSQVASGMAQGKSFKEAVFSVDYADVAIATAGGFIKATIPGSAPFVDRATDFLQAAVDYKPISKDPNERGLKTIADGSKSTSDFLVDWGINYISTTIFKKIDNSVTEKNIKKTENILEKAKNKIANQENKILKTGKKINVVSPEKLLKQNATRLGKIFNEMPTVFQYELIYKSKQGYKHLILNASEFKEFAKGLNENVLQDNMKEFVDSWSKGIGLIICANGQIKTASNNSTLDAQSDNTILKSERK